MEMFLLESERYIISDGERTIFTSTSLNEKIILCSEKISIVTVEVGN